MIYDLGGTHTIVRTGPWIMRSTHKKLVQHLGAVSPSCGRISTDYDALISSSWGMKMSKKFKTQAAPATLGRRQFTRPCPQLVTGKPLVCKQIELKAKDS